MSAIKNILKIYRPMGPDAVKLFDAAEAELTAIRRERDEAQTVLRAWQESFGTSQLTHALCRLEVAEKSNVQLNEQMNEWEEYKAGFKRIVDGDRAKDEVHCSCCVELRIKLAERTATNERYVMEINRLDDKVASLTEALRTHGTHSTRCPCDECSLDQPYCVNSCSTPCTCGLTAALATATTEKEERK
jgi:hypothetical protein